MKEYHPYVIFWYYLSILAITVITMNPVILACSLLGSVLCFCLNHSVGEIVKSGLFYGGLFVVVVVTNPLFSHNGKSVLFFVQNQAITLEAIYYGIALACMLTSMMLWCRTLTELMTTDKFLYLFGKVLPKLSLLLSMVLRFVPTMKQKSQKINQTQKVMGLYTSESYWDKLKGGMRVLDGLVTWSLENGIETAASMKARGYGVRRRSTYSIFTFRRKDAQLCGMIIVLSGCVFLCYGLGIFRFVYYPTMSKIQWTNKEWFGYGSAFFLSVLPAVILIKEKLLWKLYRLRA